MIELLLCPHPDPRRQELGHGDLKMEIWKKKVSRSRWQNKVLVPVWCPNNYLLYLYDRRTSNMEELKRVPKEDVLTSIKLNSVIQDDWWRCLQDQDRTKCNFRILQFLYYSGRLIICWVCTNMSQIKKRLQSDSGAMTVINLHLTQLMTSLPGCTSFFFLF